MNFQGSALPKIDKNRKKSLQKRYLEKRIDFSSIFCDFYAFWGSPGAPKSTKNAFKKTLEKRASRDRAVLSATRCKAEIKIHPFTNTFD